MIICMTGNNKVLQGSDYLRETVPMLFMVRVLHGTNSTIPFIPLDKEKKINVFLYIF